MNEQQVIDCQSLSPPPNMALQCRICIIGSEQMRDSFIIDIQLKKTQVQCTVYYCNTFMTQCQCTKCL